LQGVAGLGAGVGRTYAGTGSARDYAFVRYHEKIAQIGSWACRRSGSQYALRPIVGSFRRPSSRGVPRAPVSRRGFLAPGDFRAHLPRSQGISPRRHAGAPSDGHGSYARVRRGATGENDYGILSATAHEPAEKRDRGSAATRSPHAFASSVGILAGSPRGRRIRVAFSCFLPGRVVGGSLAARFGAAAHRRRRWPREVPIRMIPAATNAPPTTTPMESSSMRPRDTSRA
jgi:hypothetical protein